MADMYDCGVYTFNQWAKQTIAPCGKIFHNKYLGPFNLFLSGEEANRRLDHVGKITKSGQQKFIRGFNTAKQQHLKHKNKY